LGGYSSGSIETGSIWDGYNDVMARHVGRLSQGEGGAWAGQYFFEGAFVAKMKNGMVSVFKRDGAKSLPVTQQAVKLVAAEAVASQVAAEANAELLRRFKEKFQV
jgi:hypothetical protein